MDLKLFFDPTEVEVSPSPNSFQSSIYINHHKMPEYEGMDMALIGLTEYRGSDAPCAKKAAEETRKQLYRLVKGYGDYAIVDLGNFRNGPTLEDTYLRLKEVCGYLMGKGIIPILFGGTHDLDIGQYQAYEDLNKLISLLCVDAKINLEGTTPDSAHTKTIFNHSPNYLFNYYHLAHQSFLVSQNDLSLLDSLSFEYIRLGAIKENMKEIEPIIRNADMISFDLAAVQQMYAAGAIGATLYGLSGEEACQLMWYAGQNEKLSSLGLYGYQLEENEANTKTAFLVSTMIWYFIEGYYHRKGDKDFMSNDYLKYEVHLGGHPETIRFFKSKRSERWWMEVPNPDAEGLFNRNSMVACSYSDYETAMKGEVPDRWISHQSRI